MKLRGQTSLELMFLFMVIVGGVLLVAKIYYPSDTGVSITYQLKSAAQDACTFLNEGVVVNDTVHAPLDRVIELNNYSSLNCAVSGVSVNTTSTSINAVVYITYSSRLNATLVSGAVRDYLVARLSRVNGFALRNGVLYFRGYLVSLGVVVK